jgi:hypothetical protein
MARIEGVVTKLISEATIAKSIPTTEAPIESSDPQMQNPDSIIMTTPPRRSAMPPPINAATVAMRLSAILASLLALFLGSAQKPATRRH